ncbi:MAG: hypothetical protein F6K62_01125 [Sphaerospermopsis sp. SIO1G2]|nr:hypothetical protein [Sphaerospermopsis sp. SIO1G2]
MLSDLKIRLLAYDTLDISRISVETMWQKYQNKTADFILDNSQIVGCMMTWNHSNSESIYIELGTVWTEFNNRELILTQLGKNLQGIAQYKKIIGFCKELRLVRYFKMKNFFPVNEIANYQSCPQNLINSISNFSGWLDKDVTSNSRYTRMLYQESENLITPWYVVYEQ